jgi:hypothetical protein
LSQTTDQIKPVAASGRRWVSIALGVVVSVFLLWWASRGLELGTVVAQLRRLNPWAVLLAVLIATLSFPLRLLRWRILLRAPDGGPIGYGPAWHAIALGFMSNNVLALRAGELVRCYAASRLAPVKFSTALASVAVERVFDSMTVVASLIIILLAGTLPEGTVVGGVPVDRLAGRVALIAFAALAAAAIVLWTPSTFRRVIRSVVPFPRIAEGLVHILDGILEGIGALKSPRLLLAVIGWSAVIWLVNGVSFLILFQAFGLSLSFSAALLVQAAIVFSIALPSSPGFVGVFEAAVVASLGLYGVPQDQAFAYAITYHVATFLPITLLGLYSLIRTPLHWSDIRTGRKA